MRKFSVKKGPFLKHKNTSKKMEINLFIALLPIILFGFYKNGIYPYTMGRATIYGMLFPLIFLSVSTFAGFLFEVLFTRFLLHKKGKELKEALRDSFSIYPGLFLGLILPINTPLSIVIFGSFMATIIGKMIYGGFGNNIFNPALIGRLFIISIYATTITQMGGCFNVYELDTISSATPLANASIVEGIGTYESLIAPYGSLSDFFFGFIPGTIGETSAFLCIIGFIYLVLTRVIKWKIPIFYIGTVFVMTFIIGRMNGLELWYPLFQIFSGGLMFGAVFMATDPVTSPTTSIGQIIYAFFLGILTVVFRYLTPFPEGVLTSILTMNLFVAILDRIGSSSKIAIKKIGIPFIIAMVAIIGISYYIGSSYQIDQTKGDPNYEVLETKTNGNQVQYTVTQKGNGGPIKAEITLINQKVVAINILEHKETASYYQLVEHADYINYLIKNQTQMKDLDTVSGATVSSSALKKMLINTINLEQGEK